MSILLHAHSILRWIILILSLVVIINSLNGFRNNKIFTSTDNKWSLYLFISCHVMLLIGLVQYIFGANGLQLFTTNPVSVVMKTKELRYFAIEHTIVNMIGIAFYTIARIASKKATTDYAKHRKLFMYTTIGLLLILSRIPWPWMQGVGRGWF
jgi:hypothetical protein